MSIKILHSNVLLDISTGNNSININGLITKLVIYREFVLNMMDQWLGSLSDVHDQEIMDSNPSLVKLCVFIPSVGLEPKISILNNPVQVILISDKEIMFLVAFVCLFVYLLATFLNKL